MIALAISLAHWLLISISMSVRPVNSFFPPYHAVFDELGRKMGRPPLTWEQFVSMTAPGESLVVGDKVEVATKIARIDHELGGV